MTAFRDYKIEEVLRRLEENLRSYPSDFKLEEVRVKRRELEIRWTEEGTTETRISRKQGARLRLLM